MQCKGLQAVHAHRCTRDAQGTLQPPALHVVCAQLNRQRLSDGEAADAYMYRLDLAPRSAVGEAEHKLQR